MRETPRQFLFGTGSTVTSAPASEPLEVAFMKDWLKMNDTTADDTIISNLIAAARTYIESHTNLKLFTQTVQEKWDYLPPAEELKNYYGGISLLWFPVQSITSISYVDADGDTQVLAGSAYTADLASRPCRITPAYGSLWPTVRDQMNAITVTYVAGYSSVANIPEAIKTAMQLMITDWYDNRADSVKRLPTAAGLILQEYKPNIHV